MHLELLTEELSAEAALKNLLPRIVGNAVSFSIHPYDGKRDLLAKLPDRLRGYSRWIPGDVRVVVLVDEDRQDCRDLKTRMEGIAQSCGLATRSRRDAGGGYTVINRLAIEELEAWFFGDVGALVAAYPRVPRTLGSRQRFRNPDAIVGGTWEALESVLQRAGYYSGGLPKIEVAQRISALMNPDSNTSKSFQVFRDALREMAS
jgi:hypothetical protein